MENELDCRGLQCPEPVARCRSALKKNTLENISVLVDNIAALENVCRFLERNGFSIETKQPYENVWRISGYKNSQAPEVKATDLPQKEEARTLVLLTTQTLGRGDDELGARLMQTFLANLSELGQDLWRIILLNGAVKLSVEEGEAMESLKALAASGVGIYVCGTCLMHYGLLENKQIGETTNMMDIISSLAIAQKIIRP